MVSVNPEIVSLKGGSWRYALNRLDFISEISYFVGKKTIKIPNGQVTLEGGIHGG